MSDIKKTPRHSAASLQAADRKDTLAPIQTAAVSANTKRLTKKVHKNAPRSKHAAHTQDSSRTQRPVLYVVLAFIVLTAVVSAFIFIPRLFNGEPAKKTNLKAGQEIKITIEEGSSGTAIANLLVDKGVIGDSAEFLSRAKKLGADSKFRPGTYIFIIGSDIDNVIDLLISGPNSEEDKITVAEGLTIKDLAKLVEKTFSIPAQNFIDEAKASKYVDDYPFLEDAAKSSDSLEGYLFPKTYHISKDDVDADLIIRTMLDQWKKETETLKLKDALTSLNQTYNTSLSEYDLVKLASLIEKEAITDEQRPKVSSVFMNRLREKMLLQSDATMGYVTGGKVTSDDLKVDNPYNTYIYKGFPPTPICSPSLESLKAAANPETTDFLFFWITNEEEQFSKTNDEHEQAFAD